MRVAYLTNQYPTVSHTFIRREIQELERLGHQVERYTIRDTRGKFVEAQDQREWEQTYRLMRPLRCLVAAARMVFTRPARVLKALRADFRLWQNRKGIVRHVAYFLEASHLVTKLDKNVSHLHAHFGTNSTSVAMLSHLLGGPKFSFTVHGPEEFDRPEAESLPEKIAAAAFVVGVSEFGRSQLKRWCRPEDQEKIHVVRCGLGDDFLSRPIQPIADTNRLLCVARLSPQKGLFTLFDAAVRLAQGGVDFELILAGDGPLRSELESRAAAPALRGRVQLVGNQTSAQIQDLLDGSRVFVLPSHAEGLPVVIMEAFALGRPVISTYVAGIPELVCDGDNGWLVTAGSAEELTAAICQALEKPVDELQQMGLCGRERVLANHSARTQAKELATLFGV